MNNKRNFLFSLVIHAFQTFFIIWMNFLFSARNHELLHTLALDLVGYMNLS